MSSDLSDGTRFDELVARHLDRTLDAVGRAELAACLRADPVRRHDYLRLLEQDELLVIGAREILTPSARIEAARLPRRTRRVTRRSHIRRWTAWIGWASAALVLVVVGAFTLRSERAPFQATLDGLALIERGGDVNSRKSDLRHGDVLIAQGTATLRFPDGGALATQPETRLVLRSDGNAAQGVEVALMQGVIRCDLPPQPRGFSVRTGEAQIAVIGTVFQVESSPGASLVMVDAGRVRVRSATAEAQLSPGEQARITTAGILRAAADAPAHLADPARWLASGKLAATATVGGATLAATPTRQVDVTQWSGRAWRWYAPLPSSAAIAMQARFVLPAADDGVWHGEVFFAPPDAHQDADEAQPSPCLRLGVRSGIPTVVRRTTPEVDPQVLWTGEELPPGARMLRLELRDGQVSALIDGAVVWRGPMPYTTVVPGLRWTRRAAGASAMTIDQVALESLLPR